MEASTLRMHATMMSAIPAIRYWTPGSVAVMDTVESMRKEGLSAYFTMDAGSNVKVLCRADEAEQVAQRLATHCERVEILWAGPMPTSAEPIQSLPQASCSFSGNMPS